MAGQVWMLQRHGSPRLLERPAVWAPKPGWGWGGAGCSGVTPTRIYASALAPIHSAQPVSRRPQAASSILSEGLPPLASPPCSPLLRRATRRRRLWW